MSITWDEIADVCRAHDKFMIEAREWLRRPHLPALPQLS
jgi:hypothetical protein